MIRRPSRCRSTIEESYDNAYWPPYAYPYGKAADERPLLPEEDLRELFHAYYSAVTLMDHNLGRVLDFADANNLWDNTVIIFASDNGFSLMEHLHLYSKRNYSRESIHVPMMIHHPGMATEGRVCDRQVGLIDVLPTALGPCRSLALSQAHRWPVSGPTAGESGS
ncbi:MAG: hypothetical protein CMN05_02985 [Roseibacillus sp.]|nr:hypothetical protein [Roseibacillus sp.]